MRVVTLKTGVKVTFNDKDEIVSLSSPYDSKPTNKTSVLRYYANQIKKIIS